MSQSGSVAFAVCSRRPDALVICTYTFSSRSAQALIDSCLFRLSPKKYFRILRHLSDRKTTYLFTNSPEQILKSKPLSEVPVLQSLDQFPSFFHLSLQTVAPHVLSPVSVLTYSAHLETNDTVRRSQRMSRILVPDCQSVCHLRHRYCRKLRYQCSYHNVSFNCV